ncbi:MAG: hypothetical protein Q8O83_01840 [bacterium]|nr:hypothetical protein [bacterium]
MRTRFTKEERKELGRRLEEIIKLQESLEKRKESIKGILNNNDCARVDYFLQEEGSPILIFDCGDFLFPQYDGQFIDFIIKNRDWLQELAHLSLESHSSGHVHSDVRNRWKEIANGSFFENIKKIEL